MTEQIYSDLSDLLSWLIVAVMVLLYVEFYEP